MITAARHPIGEWFVWQLVRHATITHFSVVHARQRGEVNVREPADLPTIYYITHSSWWDGYLCMVLDRVLLHQEPYLIMDEKNLRRYCFFTWAGAFGIDRDDGRTALASLDYAADLLRGHPERSLHFFPQGSITPSDRRPLQFHSGLARLVSRMDGARLIPVALRYEFLQEQRPEVFASIGPARIVTSQEAQHHRALTATLIADLTTELDLLVADIIAERFASFTTVLQGHAGIDRAFDRLMLRRRRQSRRHAIEAGHRLSQDKQ